MNSRQKIVQQQFLKNEEAVIRQLNGLYQQSLNDINRSIREHYAAIQRITDEINALDPNDPQIPILESRRRSKVYQKEYQEQLKKQVSDILDNMNSRQYTTVSDYLTGCYDEGFAGAMYDLQGQGIPVITPINQQALVHAVQIDSKISQGLYTRLGVDVAKLKQKIPAEVSRMMATGKSYAQCAKNLTGITNVGFNNAIRIVRTEGHRIQTTAAMDAMTDAKDRGADVVKQWDSTLDGRTRESHRAVDGEIRELKKKFSNGLMFPGDGSGRAAEVVNCRCALLQRARWALDDSFTKVDSFVKDDNGDPLIRDFNDPKDYDQFKKWYFSDENVKYMNYATQLERRYGTKDWQSIFEQMTDREYSHLKKLEAASPLFKTHAPAVPDPVAPVTADMIPAAFRKVKQGKVTAQVMADALNDAMDLNPNIRKLYSEMDNLPNIPGNGYSISYTGSGHAINYSYLKSTGEVTDCKVKIPKMLGDDLIGQKGTTFHEVAHLIDLCSGKGHTYKTEMFPKLSNAIRTSGKDFSDDIRHIFDEFASQRRTVADSLRSTYKAKRSALSADYKAGKITWTEYDKQWKALFKEEDLERDYQVRNLLGGGVDKLSDIYDALSGGYYQDSGTLLYGHGGKYYSQAGQKEAEIFANYMSLSVNHPDLIELLRKDKPDLCDALDEMIEEMAGALK